MKYSLEEIAAFPFTEVIAGAVGLFRLESAGEGCVDAVRIQHRTQPHYHKNTGEEIEIVGGSGTIIRDGQKRLYVAGDTFSILKGTCHGFNPAETTYLISRQAKRIITFNEKGEITGKDIFSCV